MLRTKASLSVDDETPSPLQTIVRRRHEAGNHTGPLAPVREQASLTCSSTSLAQAMPYPSAQNGEGKTVDTPGRDRLIVAS